MRIAQQVQPYLIGGPNIKTTQNFVVGSVSLHGFAANRLVGNPLKICVAVPFLLDSASAIYIARAVPGYDGTYHQNVHSLSNRNSASSLGQLLQVG